MPTFGSLFAGVGGFDLALEAAGFTSAFQVEIDPKANAILAKHWPDIPRFTDIREVTSHVVPEVEWIARRMMAVIQRERQAVA